MDATAISLQTYRHSGQLGRSAWLLPVGGLIAATVLGVLYGGVCCYNPLIGWISGFLCAAFGYSMGVAISKLAVWGHCRNTRFVYMMTGIIGLWGLYVAWASFVTFLLAKNSTAPSTSMLGTLLINPSLLYSLMDVLTVNGYFTVKTSTPTGVLLWIFWAVETIIIGIALYYVAAEKVKDSVYCEPCQGWAKTNLGFAHMGAIRAPSWEERVRSGDLHALLEAPEYERSSTTFLRLDNQVCERCKATETTRLVRISLITDDKGKVTENLTPVTDVMLLDDQAKLTLVQVLAKRQEDAETQKAARIEEMKKKTAEQKAIVAEKKENEKKRKEAEGEKPA